MLTIHNFALIALNIVFLILIILGIKFIKEKKTGLILRGSEGYTGWAAVFIGCLAIFIALAGIFVEVWLVLQL